MRGLLEKDIRLLLQRKNILGVFVVLAFVLGLSQSGAFILGYLPFLILIVLISTISYDEVENGYRFLMTLPVNRRLYVQEKYLFCILGTMSAWMVASILYFLAKVARAEVIIWKQDLPTVGVFCPIIFLMLSFIIPMQLKYGAEKSRIMLIGCIGVIMALIYMIGKLLGREQTMNILQRLGSIPESLIVMVGIGITLVAVIISFLISCRIMEKKEL